MLSFTSITLLATTLLPCAFSQFVLAPKDLTSAQGCANVTIRYKEVPAGICEMDPGVRSYAGYADVEENQHVFWWFFEARNEDPLSAPLTIYINGGPGSSSMIGVFQETGPCGVDHNGDLYNNPYSWSNASNMIYIDQPTQVGFSYSIPVPGYVDSNSGFVVVLPNATCPDYAGDTCGTYSYPNFTLTANSTQAAAPNMWKTIQGFMGAFPEYSRNGIHFSTGSYGGHFGPVFSEYFETQNAKKIAGSKEIRFESLSVYNGWYDPRIQYGAYYNYSLNNTYDFRFFNGSVQRMMYNSMWGAGNCLDQLNDCNTRGIDEICSQADNFCYQEVEYLLDLIQNRDEYDIRELMPDPFPYSFFIDYLNRPDIQNALGAYQNFSEAGGNIGVGTVGTAFTTTGDDARVDGTIAAVKALLHKGVRVMAYTGDADYNCNWLGGQAVAHEIAAPGFDEAGFENLTTSDGIVHGVVKQSGNYSFLRIYDSGHEVSFYQPLTALTIFSRLLNRLDIATGKIVVTDSYKSVGPTESLFREGNSTIQQTLPSVNATYNVTTNEPNSPADKTTGRIKRTNKGKKASLRYA